MKKYLVINESKTPQLFKDQYKLFTKLIDAVTFAKTIGFQNMFEVSDAVGMKTIYVSGDINVSIMVLEEL